MTEPVDPNEPPSYPPASYREPQPWAPQPWDAQQPGGQPAWPAYGNPYPDPYVPTAPAPRRRSRALLVGVVVVAVLAAAGVVTYLATRGSGGSASRTFSAPASFDGYSQLHNDAAKQVESTMRAIGGSERTSQAREALSRATIAVYAHDSGDRPTLITLVIPIPHGGAGNADDITSGLTVLATSTTDFPPGPQGGALRCGPLQLGAVSGTVCAWTDEQAVGLLESIGESVTPARLAQLTRVFRSHVE